MVKEVTKSKIGPVKCNLTGTETIFDNGVDDCTAIGATDGEVDSFSKLVDQFGMPAGKGIDAVFDLDALIYNLELRRGK